MNLNRSIVAVATMTALATGVKADLTPSYVFNGTGNWSIDAVGSNATPVGTVDALVPAGSTVEAAFLYSSTLGISGTPPDVTVDATNYSGGVWTSLGTAFGGNIEAWRTDVTTQMVAAIGGGGGVFSFTVIEETFNSNTDGEVLVVIYSNPAEMERSIFLLDGVQASAGDTTTVFYSEPLDTTTPGFEALASIAVGFGFQGTGMESLIDVNGRRLTSAAGGQDDGGPFNGGLITAGGLGDSPINPVDPFAGPTGDPRFDDEYYNLALGNGADPAGFLSDGELSTVVFSENPSDDDILFFLGLNITAEAVIDDSPCCLPDGSCEILDPADCVDMGGTPSAAASCDDACVDIADIPTVSEWGLIVLTLLMLTAGTIIIRRESALRTA